MGLFASSAAHSATTTTISVGATLVDHCLISATALTFQPYSPGGGAATKLVPAGAYSDSIIVVVSY